MRRTTGETTTPLGDSSRGLLGAGVGAGAVTAVATGGGAGAGEDSLGAGAIVPGSASSSMTATRAPVSTVSPSPARISTSTPAAGEGISESTLSVETSKSGSSRATASPTFLNHWVMIPSVTDSPSDGRVTSAKVDAPTRQGEQRLAEGLRERRVRLDQRGRFFGGGLPVDGVVAGTELLGDPRSGHVHAQNLTGGAVGTLL